MKVLILEVRVLKRLSKKVKTEYLPLLPGEQWSNSFEGQRVVIMADRDNSSNLYVGARK